MKSHLTDAVKTVRVLTAQAAGTGALQTDSIDLSGYSAVRFVAAWGAVTDGAPALQAQQSDDDTTFEDAGESVAAAADKLAITDIFRPTSRYVRAELTRGGSTGSAVDAVIAELYAARDQPVSADATVNEQAKSVDP